MPRTWSRLVSGTASLVLLLATSSAGAGSIEIEFDLTGSSVSLLGDILLVPPDGQVTHAHVTLSVTGSDITTPAVGVARVSDLDVDATIDGTVGNSVLITGDFVAERSAGGTGSLASDLTTLSLTSLTLTLDGMLDCTGSQCIALGTFPVSVVGVPVQPSSLDPWVVHGLGIQGAGTLTATLPFDLGGNAVLADLSGVETTRRFVPEPNATSLGSVALLALLALLRRQRAAHMASGG
ncbi:MAG: hypothetical protein VX246_09165 [Myxococcota bacterium]|nr:hypothetical protein [Myxococcota bacterium]